MLIAVERFDESKTPSPRNWRKPYDEIVIARGGSFLKSNPGKSRVRRGIEKVSPDPFPKTS
jgi:hypothetical protein